MHVMRHLKLKLCAKDGLEIIFWVGSSQDNQPNLFLLGQELVLARQMLKYQASTGTFLTNKDSEFSSTHWVNFYCRLRSSSNSEQTVQKTQHNHNVQ